MFRRSLWARWVPNYFRGQQQQQQQQRRSMKPKPKQSSFSSIHRNRIGSARATSPQKAPRCTSEVKRGDFATSMAFVTPLQTSFDQIATQRVTLQLITAKATELVAEWGATQDVLARSGTSSSSSPSHAGSLDEHGAHLRFLSLRDVLGPLALQLPVAPPHMQPPAKAALSPSHDSTSKNRAWRVVPDGAVASVATAPADAAPFPAPPMPVTALSLDELVTCLQLYDFAGCEDGELLLRLLGEVHRFFFGNLSTAVVARNVDVAQALRQTKLPLPQLLFTLSQLGISEEQVLQVVIRRPAGNSRGGTLAGGGLLYTQLPKYTPAELILLLVALHRFGLHQDHACGATVRTLDRLHLSRASSDAFAFSKAVARTVAKFAAPQPQMAQRVGGAVHHHRDGLTHDSFSPGELGAAAAHAVTEPKGKGTVFDHLPDLPPSLTCSSALLVEALTALSLSLFRRREVVRFLANVMVATSTAELARIVGDQTYSSVDKQVAINAVSHKLLRGVRLCEEMSDPQLLLAECLAFSIDVAQLGVLADGGEDTDGVSSERRAYYDHVTADLVKVSRCG